jgi:murein DD-endopeptidase MepM/ murein hydrolase activator NlpD
MIRVLFVSLLFYIFQVQAQDTEKPWTEEVRTGDSFELFVNNPLYGPISVHFDVIQTNMQPSQEESFDIVILARSRTLAFTISPTDKEKPWEFDYKFRWYLGDITAVHDGTVVYDLPFEKGQGFTLMQGYNGTFSHQDEYQYSVDFDTPVGTPVTAAREGTVILVETSFSEGGPDPALEDKSNFITILHTDNTMADYVHLRQNGSLVSVGQQVQRGEVIGYSGNVGYSTSAHLHFHIYTRTDTSGNWQSLPVRFNVAGEAVELQEGSLYSH